MNKKILDSRDQIGFKELWEHPFSREIMCKHFGCGKLLSLDEQLYSDYCFRHIKQNRKTAIELKSLSQVFYYSNLHNGTNKNL